MTRADVTPLLDELRALGSAEKRASMIRTGIKADGAFGVSIYDLRKVAQRLGTDHRLALALWATGQHEARLLACFVDSPAEVTEEQVEAWASGFDSWDVCDQACTSLFDLTVHAWPKAAEWALRDEEWVKRAGFALMAGLAVHDRESDDAAFLRLLPLIERGARDDRNYVKKAVNWALRNIGKRNLALNAAAQACAKKLQAAAKGTAPAMRAMRWVGGDALRELASEKVRGRLERKEPVEE